MRKGSRHDHLQSLALAIYKACFHHEIDLRVLWRSRNDPRLQIADEFSRPLIDVDDWMIDSGSFEQICARFGRPQVDLFANNINARVTLYYSAFATSSGLGTDCFTADWALYDLSYACPPPKYIKAAFIQAVR